MPNQPLLAYNVWLALPVETRVKLTKLFAIPRTGEVIVQTGEMMNGNIGSIVKNDGHAAGDLYAITVEKMQALLRTDDTDFYKMFNHIVENIDYVMESKDDIVTLLSERARKTLEKNNEDAKNFAELMNDKPKKRGRKPKNAQE